MAPKKPNPMEDPPAASSEEEEETEEEESSSGEEEDDDEETPERTQPPSPPPKQPASKKPELSKSSSSDEESGSESESDEEPEPTPKPIATKPMEETTPKVRISKPASKRANETEGTQKEAKRAKKKGTDGGGDGEEEEAASESKKPGEETKKQLFQRLWSEDDEIAVLKGMIEFSTKKGIDPNQDMNGFHDFIKKSLHVDVSRTQVVDKIRRLRKKYVNNLGKGIQKGEDVTFSKPHEQKAYELSKKVWGGEGSNVVVDSAVKSNGKPKKVQNQKGNTKQLAALKPELANGPKEVEKMDVDNQKELSLKIVDVEKYLLDRSAGVAGLEDFVINSGLNMIGASKKVELEQRWRKLQIAQLELYVERTNLVREQAELMLKALKSSDDK